MFSIGGRRIRRKTMTIRTLIVDDEAHTWARSRGRTGLATCSKARVARGCRPRATDSFGARIVPIHSGWHREETTEYQPLVRIGTRCELRTTRGPGFGGTPRDHVAFCTVPRSQAPRVFVMLETEAAKAGLPLPTAASVKPKCC